MLPKDRKELAAKEKEQREQSTLDKHLAEPAERVIPYSDKLFRSAAIEWLVCTGQVCPTHNEASRDLYQLTVFTSPYQRSTTPRSTR